MGDHSETQTVAVTRRGKRTTYAKISLKAKLVLFQRVLEENASTRETARALGIKYSTAKTLIRNYSHMFHKEDQELVKTACQEFAAQGTSIKRCGYALITANRGASQLGDVSLGMRQVVGNKIEIISSIFPTKQK